MKRKLLPFIVLFSAIFLFDSCLNDNDNGVVYYNDTAITAFTPGTLNQYLHTKTASGKDSVYKKTLTGSKFPFYIDQMKNEIYNPDSLPYGTDAKHVICTITSKNSGVIALKSMTSDSMKYYSNADSIDFTQPRKVYVYNLSNTASRIYTVRVNVHQQEPDVFNWVKGLPANTQLAALSAMHAVANNGNIYVYGIGASGSEAYSTADTDGTQWTKMALNVTLSADACRNIVVKESKFYALNNGTVLVSTNGATWQQVSTVASLKRMVGASSTKLYAITTDNKIAMSADNGKTWNNESMDADAKMLPTESISFISMPLATNDSTYKLTIVGNRDATEFAQDSHAMVWGKVEENAQNSENQSWSYYEVSSDNRFVAPHLRGIQVIGYGNVLLAFGGTGIGSYVATPFSQFYESLDGGITWKKNENITVPSDFSSSEESFTMVKDSKNFVWIICGLSGQVWKGRTNKLGWATTQTSFYK